MIIKKSKVIFLEKVLETLAPKCNVLVLLSSQTVYGIGETDEPIVSQDHCGNHYVDNWLTAMCGNEKFKNRFIVDKIEVETYDNDLQYTITLVNGKDRCSNELAYDTNEVACKQAFHF